MEPARCNFVFFLVLVVTTSFALALDCTPNGPCSANLNCNFRPDERPSSQCFPAPPSNCLLMYHTLQMGKEMALKNLEDYLCTNTEVYDRLNTDNVCLYTMLEQIETLLKSMSNSSDWDPLVCQKLKSDLRTVKSNRLKNRCPKEHHTASAVVDIFYETSPCGQIETRVIDVGELKPERTAPLTGPGCNKGRGSCPAELDCGRSEDHRASVTCFPRPMGAGCEDMEYVLHQFKMRAMKNLEDSLCNNADDYNKLYSDNPNGPTCINELWMQIQMMLVEMNDMEASEGCRNMKRNLESIASGRLKHMCTNSQHVIASEVIDRLYKSTQCGQIQGLQSLPNIAETNTEGAAKVEVQAARTICEPKGSCAPFVDCTASPEFRLSAICFPKPDKMCAERFHLLQNGKAASLKGAEDELCNNNDMKKHLTVHSPCRKTVIQSLETVLIGLDEWSTKSCTKLDADLRREYIDKIDKQCTSEQHESAEELISKFWHSSTCNDIGVHADEADVADRQTLPVYLLLATIAFAIVH